MPDEQQDIPTKHAGIPRAGGPAEDGPITDSELGGMLGAGHSKPSTVWQPPSPEGLQLEFPQYEIRDILGRGGMGAVYKGWQTSLDRWVAIKILPPGFDDGVSDFTERFKREAKAMAQLKHPGIVAVYDAGKTRSGLLYFVMECIVGTDVQKLIAERQRLSPAEAVRITAAVCDALAYAHRHDVIHRDIKPANIMIEDDGDVKVADFGLAKSTAPDTTMLTMSNVAMGTLDFMAPEAMKAAATVDHRADLYSVGVMLYQMLTGSVPRGKYDPPSRRVPGLDKRLDRIVDRALQPEPAARYSSANEISAALAPITASLARRAPVEGRRPVSRSQPLVLFATVAALLGVGFLVRAKIRGPIQNSPPAVNRVPTFHGTSPVAATMAAPFVNSIGQEFVPVPGTRALFCRWETRVQDYAKYANAMGADDAWMGQVKDGVAAGREPLHPVCGVSWDAARDFCAWLTKKEIGEGKLPAGVTYRLPSDEEWSRAVGLEMEDGATPRDRSGKNDFLFPWGTDFPPKSKVGNYADSTYHEKFPQEQWVADYTDGFATTAPVGSFPANKFGIFDLGGNVWEWCEDLYEPRGTTRVVRGGSWAHYDRDGMLASYRRAFPPDKRLPNYGFRCVLGLPPK